MRARLIAGFISVFFLLSVISGFMILTIEKEHAIFFISIVCGALILMIGYYTDRLFIKYSSEYNFTRGELERAKQNAEAGQEELRKRDIQNNALIKLISIINRVQKPELLFKSIINYLCKVSGAHIGIIYFVDEEKNMMQFAGSFPEKIQNQPLKNIPFDKGRCGQVVRDKKIRVFTEQPEDYLKIETSLGGKQAENILIYPVIEKEKVLALIEIGSFQTFSDSQKEFFELANNSIANAITLSLSRDEISTLLDNTQNQSYELEKKAKELEQANKEADRARNTADNISKAKRKFFENMSREMTPPLSRVVNMVSMLFETELSEKQLDLADSIKINSELMLEMLNDILDFSGIEAGKNKIKKNYFKLHPTLEKLKMLVRLKTNENKIKFDFNIEKNVPENLIGDPVRLNQILVNLTVNALNFSKDGEIVIRVALKNETNSDIRLFFEVFNKAADFLSVQTKQKLKSDALSTKNYTDNSLAFIISKQLVEFMGGRLGIEKTKDTGAIFWFTINLKKQFHPADDLRDTKTDEVLKQEEKSDENYKILLVEDNKINQKVAFTMLKKMGHQIAIADNGAQAVELVKKDSSYDFILMDSHLPVLNGLDATILIRKKNPRIPIIALTANVMKGDRERFIAAGMDDFVAKPIKKDRLVEVIEKCLKKNKSMV